MEEDSLYWLFTHHAHIYEHLCGRNRHIQMCPRTTKAFATFLGTENPYFAIYATESLETFNTSTRIMEYTCKRTEGKIEILCNFRNGPLPVPIKTENYCICRPGLERKVRKLLSI